MGKGDRVMDDSLSSPSGHSLGARLVSHYLFPASKMILDSEEPRQPGIININPMYASLPALTTPQLLPPSLPPRCSDVSARVAAYDLLVELCTGCYDNFALIAKRLITMHHKPNPQITKEWEVRVQSSSGECGEKFFSSVPASSGGQEWVWLCGSEECWCHVLHELCPAAALHDPAYQRGECVGRWTSGRVT